MHPGHLDFELLVLKVDLGVIVVDFLVEFFNLTDHLVIPSVDELVHVLSQENDLAFPLFLTLVIFHEGLHLADVQILAQLFDRVVLLEGLGAATDEFDAIHRAVQEAKVGVNFIVSDQAHILGDLGQLSLTPDLFTLLAHLIVDIAHDCDQHVEHGDVQHQHSYHDKDVKKLGVFSVVRAKIHASHSNMHHAQDDVKEVRILAVDVGHEGLTVFVFIEVVLAVGVSGL